MFVEKKAKPRVYFSRLGIYVILGTGNEQNIYSLREMTATGGIFFLQTFIPYRGKNTRFLT